MNFLNKTYTPGETEVYYISGIGAIRKGIIHSYHNRHRNGCGFLIKETKQFAVDEIYNLDGAMVFRKPEHCFPSLKQLLNHLQTFDKE